jgi:tRNA pseudouridine32 synthase / 23S rRNA pseudouridine746 synthase
MKIAGESVRDALARFPTKNGVGPSCVVLPPAPWEFVIDFLEQRFPNVPRAEILARMARGDVLNADGKLLALDAPYIAHQMLFYYRHIVDEPVVPFAETVLFEDEHLVIADKPHFLPVTPGGRYVQESLLVRLKRKLNIDSLAPVHRIDRETAGLVMFTKQPQTRGIYHALFAKRRVAKRYEAIAPYKPSLLLPMTYRSRLVEAAHFMQMQEIGGTANSETLIELVEVHEGLARYRLTPHSGKKHQLRVHMAALGVPILHDQMYPTLTSTQDADSYYTEPLQLLAKSLAFTDPISGVERYFESRLKLGGLHGLDAIETSLNHG